MKALASKPLLLLLVSLLLVLGCKQEHKYSKLPYYNTPDFTPLWDSAISSDTVHRIGKFQFSDQDGKQIGDSIYRDKIFVANFFFTSCAGICPRMTNNLSEVAKSFKTNPDVRFASFSVMPESDSVAALTLYATANNISAEQWHLLTGNKNDLYHLARQSFFVEEEAGFNKDSSDFLHTEHLVLVDKHGHIRGLYDGTLPLETERLTSDIKTLLAES